MAERRQHNGVWYTRNNPGDAWVRESGPVVIQDPTGPFQAPQAQADLEQTAAQTDASRASAQSARASAAAAAELARGRQIENRMAETEAGQFENAQVRRNVMQAFKTDNILGAIRNARRIIQEEGGTGWEGLLASLPATTARTLKNELQPIVGNLSFDRLQQMRDESKTGGALGSVSERELELLGSTVASLDTLDDAQAILDRLDTIERSFITAQMGMLGVDPTTDQGRAIMRDGFGYNGVSADEIPESQNGLASPDATQSAGSLPEAYQQQHLRYLRDNWGNMDPTRYAQFRANLDSQFDLTPDLRAYEGAVQGYNALAQSGGSPEQLGPVPASPQAMGLVERGINTAAQSAPGAFMANVGNATGMGLPAYLGGDQRALELLREQRPGWSLAGEMVGGALGTAALGGMGAGIRGGRIAQMLTNPGTSEFVHSGVYGATQDTENPLRGAALGITGAGAGMLAGRQIGKAFPQTFGRNAIREADQTVPTAQQLRDQEGALYAQARSGPSVGATETTDLADRVGGVMRKYEQLDSVGNYIGLEDATRQAFNRIEDLRGQTLTPGQGESIRRLLRRGGGSLEPTTQAISAEMVEQFDDWADPLFSGFGDARKVAQRRIMGEALGREREAAMREGLSQKGNDIGDAMRTRFRGMDRQDALGRPRFTPEVQGAIGRVSQGDATGNALRNVGKWGFGSVMPTTGVMGGGAGLSYLTGNPLPAAGAAALGGIGTLARRAAQNRTLRAAEEAELLARGGPEYQRALQEAYSTAAANGGRFFGGLFGAGATALPRY